MIKFHRLDPLNKMPRQSERVVIPGDAGPDLAAIFERPAGAPPRGWIVFCHCFTCSKDLKTLVRVCRGLAEASWATARFDFAGVGQSGGVFADTNFDTNLRDLDTVCRHLEGLGHPVDFVAGHSFGGVAATYAAAKWLEGGVRTCRGVVTLAAPSNTAHLADTLAAMNPRIETDGYGEVTIGGMNFEIGRQMLENFRSHDYRVELLDARRGGAVPHLLLHSLADETVDYSHGTRLYNLLRVPTGNPASHDVSFVTLPQSNHLLTGSPSEVEEVVRLIDLWCGQRLVPVS